MAGSHLTKTSYDSTPKVETRAGDVTEEEDEEEELISWREWEAWEIAESD